MALQTGESVLVCKCKTTSCLIEMEKLAMIHGFSKATTVSLTAFSLPSDHKCDTGHLRYLEQCCHSLLLFLKLNILILNLRQNNREKLTMFS